MLQGCFITATGTDAGKTHISLAVISALQARGTSVCAVKPLETGCDPEPSDAVKLAQACKRPRLARAEGLYRARHALAPAACARLEARTVPSPNVIARTCLDLPKPNDYLLIEGAGGLLVPLDNQHTIADLASELSHLMKLAMIIVAPDRLGTLSDTLCTYEAALNRKLPVAAIVLNAQDEHASHGPNDLGGASNHALLTARLQVPVLRFSRCLPDSGPLAIAAEQSGLAPLLAALL